MRKLFFMSKCLPKTTFFRMWSTLRASKNRAPFQTTTFKSWWCIDFLILILTNSDFFITIKSNLDQQTIINTNFPDEGAITLNPGTNTLKFSIIQMPKGIYSAVFGKYTIPINIIGQQINQSTDKLTVSPKLIRETLKQGKQKNYTFSIINEITPNGSANITISLKKLNKPIFENILIAKDNEVLENITFEISFTDNENITQNNSNTKYYCSELGGKFCSTLETCSGETVQSLDGSCCVGVCAIEESESSNWISYVLVLSILIVIIIIYMRYKKTKSIKSKNLAINSILKKRI